MTDVRFHDATDAGFELREDCLAQLVKLARLPERVQQCINSLALLPCDGEVGGSELSTGEFCILGIFLVGSTTTICLPDEGRHGWLDGNVWSWLEVQKVGLAVETRESGLRVSEITGPAARYDPTFSLRSTRNTELETPPYKLTACPNNTRLTTRNCSLTLSKFCPTIYLLQAQHHPLIALQFNTMVSKVLFWGGFGRS